MTFTKYFLLGTLAVFLFYIARNTTIKVNISFKSGLDTIFKENPPIVEETPDSIIGESKPISHNTNDDLSLYKIKYVTNSNTIPIGDDMILKDADDFKIYEHVYKKLIAHCFSPNQTKSIKEIVLSNSSAFDAGDGNSSTGLCATTHTKTKSTSSILIACRNNNHLKSLLHECCHALYYDYYELFKMKYKDRWENIDDQYVTEYAETKIEEDFAETGAAYLSGNYPESCIDKIKLFEEFYKETK